PAPAATPASSRFAPPAPGAIRSHRPTPRAPRHPAAPSPPKTARTPPAAAPPCRDTRCTWPRAAPRAPPARPPARRPRTPATYLRLDASSHGLRFVRRLETTQRPHGQRGNRLRLHPDHLRDLPVAKSRFPHQQQLAVPRGQPVQRRPHLPDRFLALQLLVRRRRRVHLLRRRRQTPRRL